MEVECHVLSTTVNTRNNLNFSFFLLSLFILATRAALEPDVALYVGLSVALVVILVFAIIGAIMLRFLRRKHGGHSPMFPVGSSGKISSKSKNKKQVQSAGYIKGMGGSDPGTRNFKTNRQTNLFRGDKALYFVFTSLSLIPSLLDCVYKLQ